MDLKIYNKSVAICSTKNLLLLLSMSSISHNPSVYSISSWAITAKSEWVSTTHKKQSWSATNFAGFFQDIWNSIIH